VSICTCWPARYSRTVDNWPAIAPWDSAELVSVAETWPAALLARISTHPSPVLCTPTASLCGVFSMTCGPAAESMRSNAAPAEARAEGAGDND
jgi:hypothetical protein